MDRLGRDHARAVGAGNQKMVWNGVVLDQPRRNGAATGLDASGPIEQQHPVAFHGEFMRCGGA